MFPVEDPKLWRTGNPNTVRESVNNRFVKTQIQFRCRRKRKKIQQVTWYNSTTALNPWGFQQQHTGCPPTPPRTNPNETKPENIPANDPDRNMIQWCNESHLTKSHRSGHTSAIFTRGKPGKWCKMEPAAICHCRLFLRIFSDFVDLGTCPDSFNHIRN